MTKRDVNILIDQILNQFHVNANYFLSDADLSVLENCFQFSGKDYRAEHQLNRIIAILTHCGFLLSADIGRAASLFRIVEQKAGPHGIFPDSYGINTDLLRRYQS